MNHRRSSLFLKQFTKLLTALRNNWVSLRLRPLGETSVGLIRNLLCVMSCFSFALDFPWNSASLILKRLLRCRMWASRTSGWSRRCNVSFCQCLHGENEDLGVYLGKVSWARHRVSDFLKEPSLQFCALVSPLSYTLLCFQRPYYAVRAPFRSCYGRRFTRRAVCRDVSLCDRLKSGRILTWT